MLNPVPRIHTETITTREGQPFSFRMIEVVGGEFNMGADDEEAYDNEKPIHSVNVPDFWMGEFPVTQALWQTVLDENPSYFPGLDRPVESVPWNDITNRFLPVLNERCGQKYRLPSEAEWEYAARGGKHKSPFFYASSNYLKDVSWYDENSHDETKQVGLKQPNALGLYDLSGNVWEWCTDHWHSNYERAPIDGSAWIEMVEHGHSRVLRGGAWNYDPRSCRVSHRFSSLPGYAYYSFGFRLVRSSL